MKRPGRRHNAAWRCSAAALVGLWLCAIFAACTGGGKPTGDKTGGDGSHRRIDLPDTLRVATLYSPGSYFIYREEPKGYDYDLIMQMASDKGFAVALEVAPSLASAIELLDSGRVDLIAYEVPVTAEYKSHVLPCGPENVTKQVLVQPLVKGRALISDVTELAGKDVYVEADSKYEHRLVNLNNEIGGGINIHRVNREEMITEDLIDLVSRDSIPLTIVDSDIAHINKTYYPQLDINLEVSFAQRSKWGVRPDHKWLADSIDAWIGDVKTRDAQAMLLKRYFELSKNSHTYANLSFAGGKASPFDDIFRRHCKGTGWDWRLVAALGWTESMFDPTVVSWAGARGIMQLMPGTARAYGLSTDMLTDNNISVEVAVKILRDLDKSLASRVKDSAERGKFVMAAYNSGLAHILDAIALAEKHGLDPQVWDGNVARALMMKSKPEYFNDPVCRYGYFRGRETIDHVAKVYAFYEKCRQKVAL